ncbi:hypothetical protein [Pseudomonas viridiflava]|uniref:hypothetical protein n=2 Tax=Pseudomonas viridiflava TaxID=33069 RepID=UPI0013CE67C9|nr:hypothetical protein [Pseudomonas viridiflava]
MIRYNLNDNGRTFTGQPRKIDIDAAMRLFNGVALQEAIAKGDVVGYIGHQYREKFGLDVPETVIVDGKEVYLEPGTRTIYLKCFPNGDVEHEQEFPATACGRVAQRLWEGKMYGFSSAIHAPEVNGLRSPRGYFGMDLVRAPNYDANRGYTTMLDSVSAGGFGTTDTFLSDNAAMLDSVDAMIRESDKMAEEISKSYLQQCELNDELLDRVAQLQERLVAAGQPAPMLDSANQGMVRGINMNKGEEMLDSAKRFMTADLPGYEDPEKDKADAEEAKGVISTVKSALAIVGSVMRGH